MTSGTIAPEAMRATPSSVDFAASRSSRRHCNAKQSSASVATERPMKMRASIRREAIQVNAPGCCLRAVACAELAQQSPHMILDRKRTNRQRVSDFGVAAAPLQQSEYFGLPVCRARGGR
jgi:hypothetical protein